MRPAEIEAARKEFCLAGCPVRRDCLLYALLQNERWGVWGGLTHPERQRALDSMTVRKIMAEEKRGRLLKLVMLP
jgi:hypothetical protein